MGGPSLSLAGFYWQVLSRAFSGKFWLSEKISGAAALICGAIVLFFGLAESHLAWVPFAVFGAVFVATIVYGLTRAPHEIYLDEEGRRIAAEEKLTPKLRLSLPQSAGSQVGFGSTSETISGRRQTIIQAEENVLRLTCSNSSVLRANNCQAHLVDIRRVEDDGSLTDVGFRESVPLLWNRDIRSPELATSIAGGTSKAIYVAAAKPNNSLIIYRGMDIPIEYHQIMVKPGTYRVWVHVSGNDDAAAMLAVDVRALPEPKGSFLSSCAVEAHLVDPLQPRPQTGATSA